MERTIEITYEPDEMRAEIHTCTLAEFIEANEETDCGEIDRIVAGETVTYGGGAAPLSRVRLIDAS